MKNMKRLLTIVLALCLVLSLAACSNNNSGGSSSGTDNGASTESGEWTKEGGFVEVDGENYLILYHMTEEEGYEEEGWSATIIMADSDVLGDMWGGTLQDEGGKLVGPFVTLDEDGNISPETQVTITEDGDDVVLAMDGKEYRFQVDDTDYSEFYGDMLPYFSYNEIFGYNDYTGEDRFDAVEAAAYDYLSFDFDMGDYDVEHVIIPYVQIIAVDDEDEGVSKIYGNYYVWEFEKDDDTLVAVSGGNYPGVIHCNRFGDGDVAIYSAYDMDIADTDEQNKTILGEYYDTFMTLSSDRDAVNEGCAQVISDYVHVNELEVTKYQLLGEEPHDIQ